MQKLVFLSLFSITLQSCVKLDEKYTQFYINYSANFTVPSNTGLNLPIDLFTPETETNSASTFEVNDTRKDLIEEILLEEAKMTITSPSGQTFGFLNDIYLYLSAEGLDEILIAELEGIPDDIGNEIVLDVQSQDLQEYIKKEQFSLRIKTITDKITNRDVDIEVSTRFFVDAEILGQ